jgi:hypothetical protein
MAIGGTANGGCVHYVCGGCVPKLQTIDGIGRVAWPARGQA